MPGGAPGPAAPSELAAEAYICGGRRRTPSGHAFFLWLLENFPFFYRGLFFLQSHFIFLLLYLSLPITHLRSPPPPTLASFFFSASSSISSSFSFLSLFFLFYFFLIFFLYFSISTTSYYYNYYSSSSPPSSSSSSSSTTSTTNLSFFLNLLLRLPSAS